MYKIGKVYIKSDIPIMNYKIENVKLGRGVGKSKKDAEQEAAKNAIDKLAK